MRENEEQLIRVDEAWCRGLAKKRNEREPVKKKKFKDKK